MAETVELLADTTDSTFPRGGRGGRATRTLEADRVVYELLEALRAHGITLHSLRVDPDEHGGHAQAPLIDLGRCKLATARGLTAVLSAEARADEGGSAGAVGPVGTVGKGKER